MTQAQPRPAPATHSVLGPLAEHRFLTVPQLALLLGVGEPAATRRCRQLAGAGLLRLERVFHRLPAAALITAGGLAAIGSRLAPPALNLAEYRHDVGVGWLWLAARAGRFGAPRELLTERVMQARDEALTLTGERPRAGIGVGIFGATGRVRSHYPDLLVALRSGGHVAVELELTTKSAPRTAAIMSAYASDARISTVVYLAGAETTARALQRAAAQAGIAERVHIRLLADDGIDGASIAGGPPARAAAAARGYTRAGRPASAGITR